jgi:hypothetical protein
MLWLAVTTLALGSIDGKVYDVYTDKPLAYTMVLLESPALAEPRMIHVGADGAYHFGDLPPGDYEISFHYGMGSEYDHFTVGEVQDWQLVKHIIPYPDCILINVLPRIAPIDTTTAQQGVTLDRDYLRNIPH